MTHQSNQEVFVVGAGHAGCEAALALARLGVRVTLVTLRRAGIAQMSCNPAIGGVGKGHLVREIDALGGAMAEVADASSLQCRRLNTSRGAAVRSTRLQTDSELYKSLMAERLQAAAGVTVLEDEVVDIALEPTFSLRLARHGSRRAAAVVVTAGTFLNGRCHIGARQFAGGRAGDRPVAALSATLGRLGLTLRRFKTGTTPRLDRASIDWAATEAQPGDQPPPRLSFAQIAPRLPQLACAITWTTPATHQMVRDNLAQSPLYAGILEGTGPRYCPSLEDKVVRFAARPRHQVFLEPEGLHSPLVYPAGLSNCLPEGVQDAFVRTIPGLERASIRQYGYAVEYDYAPPTQLTRALMAKGVPGLFLAGQVNGSSGYEEAAAQGLMAGINAARWLRGQPPAVLGRDQAYIGVLVDDLVTRGVDEPYRMFTARAEHRLLLRERNAEARLAATAMAWGLWSGDRIRAWERRAAEVERVRRTLADQPGLGERLRRPDADPSAIWQALGAPEVAGEALAQVVEEHQYAPYIARAASQAARQRDLEKVELPPDLFLEHKGGLSCEVVEKLRQVVPSTLGQASRIPGMTPTALSLLQIWVERRRRGTVSRETSSLSRSP